MSTPRWSWANWQKLASELTSDTDALRLAEVWPGFARNQSGKNRSMWAHEMTYETLKGWSMSRVMAAANVLEKVGLSSRCPSTPLYIPTMPKQEEAQS
jgi:hypothetical protein